MKILVLYDTRHRFTERCLSLLAADVAQELELWHVGHRAGVPNWSEYGAVVLGGPVYYGRWSKALIRFATKNAGALASCPVLGAFVVSLSPRAGALRYFAQGLPLELKGHLGQVACFGGALTLKNLSWWERLLVKKARGIDTDVGNLNLPEIQKLAAWLSAKVQQP